MQPAWIRRIRSGTRPTYFPSPEPYASSVPRRGGKMQGLSCGVDGGRVGRFETRDGRLLLKYVAKFVDAFEQAMPGEAVDGKFDGAAAGQGEGLGSQVDFDRGIGIGEQFGVDVARHDDGQKRVLECISTEDIGEGSADYGAKSVLQERPGRVLTRAAAAEIIAGEQDFGCFGLGLVQDEIRFRFASRVVAPVIEQLITEALF